MKVIRFIHPMFLTALGLHAALLFVPLGGKSETALVEEDVTLSELADESVQELQNSVTDSSPVPVFNVPAKVSAGTVVKSGVRSGAIAKSLPVKAVAPQVAPQAIRRIVASSAPKSIPSPALQPASDRGGSNVSASSPSGSALPDLTASNNASENSASESSSQERASTGNSEQGASENASAASTASLSQLIASANAAIPAALSSSLTDLTEALTYSEKGTDDESAKQALDVWKATISKQANAANLSRVEPILNSDVVLEYPIESARSFKGQSSEGVALPSIGLCLEKEPHTAEIGLMFDSQGAVVGQPELVRSTGYEALNQEIMARLIESDSFPANHESKAYLYTVTVDYDHESCVSLESLKK